MVIVFGSNTRGYHGKGAALYAKEHYGAIEGVSEGRTGDAYAIPTRGLQRGLGFFNLPLSDIHTSIHKFIHYANDHPATAFLVTRIACGYAGRRDKDIAPFFVDAPLNCIMPVQWEPWLGTRFHWHNEGQLL